MLWRMLCLWWVGTAALTSSDFAGPEHPAVLCCLQSYGALLKCMDRQPYQETDGMQPCTNRRFGFTGNAVDVVAAS